MAQIGPLAPGRIAAGEIAITYGEVPRTQYLSPDQNATGMFALGEEGQEAGLAPRVTRTISFGSNVAVW